MDTSILGCITGIAWEPFNPKSSATIARQLGIDEATVRARTRRWEESGFLTGFAVIPSVSLLGQGSCLLRLEVSRLSEKSAIARKLRLVDGVYRIRDFVGDALTVSVFYDDAETLERRVKLIEQISGATNVTRSLAKVASSEVPDPIDVLLMAAMFWPSRKTQTTVARETGLSPKSVRRRIERMVKGRMLERVNFFDFRQLKGTLIADLLVYYKNPENKEETDREIVSLIRERLFPPVWPARNSGLFRVTLGNFSEQRELLGQALALKGVSSAYLDVVVEDTMLVESLFRYCDGFFGKMANNRYSAAVRNLWRRSRRFSTDEIYPRGEEMLSRAGRRGSPWDLTQSRVERGPTHFEARAQK